jgi:hypothetical protein
MAIGGDTLYLGGHFANLTDTNTPRLFFAAVDRIGGTNRAWNPGAKGANRGCWALVMEGGRLHSGGGFSKFKTVVHPLYARFDGAT